VCTIYILWLAVSVYERRHLNYRQLAKGENFTKAECAAVENAIKDLYPSNEIKNLEDFLKDMEWYENESRTFSSNQNVPDSIRSELENYRSRFSRMESIIQFTLVNLRYLRLKRWVFALVPAALLAAVIFVLAANPSKDLPINTPLLSEPYVETLKINAQDATMLKGMFNNTKCRLDNLKAVVIRSNKDGSKDMVTVPTENCPKAILLKFSSGRLSFSS
jgi:hypothetical protein